MKAIRFYCQGCGYYDCGWCKLYDELTIDNCSVIAKCIKLKGKWVVFYNLDDVL